MSQTTHVKEIIKSEAKENLNLESLQFTVAELINMYEAVKPMIHFNVTYDLRYYNRKIDGLRSRDFLL